MTFPADVTITIASGVKTESQQADYTTLAEHFSSFDSRFITGIPSFPICYTSFL
jgi:hypothetical protein